MKHLLLTILAANLCFGQCGDRYAKVLFSSINKSTEKYGNNTLYTGASSDLYLDIYSPNNDNVTNRACIIFCFGGSFIMGSRTSPELVALSNYFASLGYVCASIDYRLDNSLNLFFEDSVTKAVIRATQDAKAAIRYLRANASRLGIDESKIFIGGTSAGGITSLTAAYAEYNDFSARNKLLIDQLGGWEGTTNVINKPSNVQAVFGFSGGIDDTLHIKNNPIPAYFNHGTQDQTVPFVYGKPLGGIAPNNIYGSLPISKRIVNMGGIAVLDSIVTSDHPTFSNSGVNYERVKTNLTNFLYNKVFGCAPLSNIQPFISNVNIQPNPASDFVSIHSDEIRLHEYELFNTMGQSVIKGTTQKLIELTAVPKGLYFIRLDNESTLKLIKE
jgi:hypothetical protein